MTAKLTMPTATAAKRARATLPDLTGRPQYLAEDDANPLPELV